AFLLLPRPVEQPAFLDYPGVHVGVALGYFIPPASWLKIGDAKVSDFPGRCFSHLVIISLRLMVSWVSVRIGFGRVLGIRKAIGFSYPPFSRIRRVRGGLRTRLPF